MMKKNWVTFREKPDIIQKIDNSAQQLGLDRSNFLRMIVRERLNQDSK